MRIECRSQAEFDACIAAGNFAVVLNCRIEVRKSVRFEAGDGAHVVARGSSQPHVVARESSQPHIEAWESSQPHVVAWESSQPHIEAWESSQPHVVARESSQPHVEAWESSQPHVVAWESSQPHVVARGSSQPHIEAWESSQPHVEARGYVQLSLLGAVVAKASANVAVLLRSHGGRKPKVTGGRRIEVSIKTPAEWCDYYGVSVARGVATLFKAVDDDFSTDRARPKDIFYRPGETPSAPDWDGGEAECGGGLHFSPSPAMALAFNAGAKRFVACPVRLKDIAVHPDGYHPEKVKAKGCCAPIYEVDRTGAPVAPPKKSSARRAA